MTGFSSAFALLFLLVLAGSTPANISNDTGFALLNLSFLGDSAGPYGGNGGGGGPGDEGPGLHVPGIQGGEVLVPLNLTMANQTYLLNGGGGGGGPGYPGPPRPPMFPGGSSFRPGSAFQLLLEQIRVLFWNDAGAPDPSSIPPGDPYFHQDPDLPQNLIDHMVALLLPRPNVTVAVVIEDSSAAPASSSGSSPVDRAFWRVPFHLSFLACLTVPAWPKDGLVEYRPSGSSLERPAWMGNPEVCLPSWACPATGRAGKKESARRASSCSIKFGFTRIREFEFWFSLEFSARLLILLFQFNSKFRFHLRSCSVVTFDLI